jgi:uncharacterized protein
MSAARCAKKTNQPFYKHGLRFRCRGCGECCRNHGEYGFVYVNEYERGRLARHLKISPELLAERYCKKASGLYFLRDKGDRCIFLKDGRCGVYGARPVQCRTWPFWPENMNRKTWFTDVGEICPGAGKGRLHSAKLIEEYLRREGKRA